MAEKHLGEGQSADMSDDVPFHEHDEPVEAVQHPMELVTDPGKRKVIVFHGEPTQTMPEEAASAGDDSADATAQDVPFQESSATFATPSRRSEGIDSIHAGVDRLGPDPNFPGRPRGANLGPVPIRSRTVYMSERGGEVRSYESTTSQARTLTVTSGRGSQVREVPFHGGLVDEALQEANGGRPGQAQGGTLDAGTLSEDAGETGWETGRDASPTDGGKPDPTEEARPKRRFGFFGRRSPKPEFHADGKGDPDVTHVYQTAVAVDKLAEEPQGMPPPATAPAPSAGGWDPGQAPSSGSAAAAQQVVFEERESAPGESRVSPVAAETWSAPRRGLKRKPAKRAARRARGPLAYPGDNHPVIDIEGIGPDYAKRLEKAGVTTTGQLAIAQPGRLAKKIGAPAKTVKGWQAQADLIKVKGVGPQFAEAMARAGIQGIDGLKGRSAKAVATKVTSYLDGLGSNVVGQGVTTKRVAAWQRSAKRLRKVRTTPAKLATPDHGIPPPWLREGAARGASARKGTGAASRSAAKRGKARPASRGARKKR